MISGTVVSVHAGITDTLEKVAQTRIELQLDGIVGDRHRGLERETWANDKQPEGTLRRNERQWSAVSLEELAAISEAMDLTESLTAVTVGANLCLSGIPELSRLPRGTVLRFESGVLLMVEEYNPPCTDMGERIAQLHTTRSGDALSNSAFSSAAGFLRGIVGVVEVAGAIQTGDEVEVVPESLPKWLRQ